MHAETSIRRWRILTVFISIFALAGCGEGDGQIRILNTAATPLPPGGGGDEPFDSGLLTNGDFEAGVAPWFGNAANVVNDGGNLVNFADIATAGPAFDVNLSQELTLTQGETYTLSFKARSDGMRTMIAGIGANEAPFDRTDTETVNLTAEWQSFEIEVTATGFGGAKSRVLFDMGANTGLVLIDDVSLMVPNGGGAAGTPIDPEVALYSTDGEPDDDHDDINPLDSGSVINTLYADDTTYSRVLSVWSGTNDSDANVAQVGFIGFAAGFAGAYETLNFKAKGMPNFVIFVRLFDGVDTLRINLTSSDFSEALTDGWYQVSIPLSEFTGVEQATGIVFESDDSAAMQFRMLLTDIGFSRGGDGNGNGDGDGDGTGDGGTVLATFDEAEPPTPGVFGNAVASIEAGPAGGDGDALKITRSVTGFSGAFIIIPAIPSDAGSQTVSAYVYSPTADIRFAAKAEYASEQGTGNVDANEAVIVGWQTLTWTFTNLDAAQEYDVFVMLPNLDVVDTESYYVDNITLVGGDTGGAGDGTGDGGTVLTTFDEAEPPTPGVFGNAVASIEAGPAGGDGDALKITRSVTGFSGAFIIIPAIPSDAGSQTVSAYVYSPTAGIRFAAKAEYASEQGTGNVDANEAVIVGWQTLTWTFTNLDAAQEYDVFVMLPNLDVVDTESYYVDNITLVGGDTGGAGDGTGDGGTVLTTFDEAEPPTPGVFGNAVASIEAGPAGGDGDALKITRSVTGFSGAFIIIPAIPSDAGSQTVSAYVYSPTADIRFAAKAEYASEQGTGNVDANEAVIVGWQTLTWTFTNLDAAQEYDVFVMLPNLDVVDTESYYVDNITVAE